VKRLTGVALGIVAALGGFVDIGDLVFNTDAGAQLGYTALWAIPVGVVGIAVMSEMSGRVAAVAGKPAFELVREQYGRRLGLTALIGSLALNFLTLCAEIGGVGLALQLLFDGPPQAWMLGGTLVLAAAAWILPFDGIERVFGYGGLGLLVYVVAAGELGPDWSAIGDGLVPHVQSSALYLYFVAGMLAAAFMPYELYFYSSGGIEEGWTEEHLFENRANAIVGFGLGGILSASLVVVGAEVLHPAGISPDTLGAVSMTVGHALGGTAVLVALAGMVFAIGGAAIDTCFAGAYSLAQYHGWEWRHSLGPRRAPRWYVTALVFFAGGYAVVATGIDPIALTEYSVVFSALVLPLSYLPVLRAARDRDLMGEHANGGLADALGRLYFGVVCVVSVAAPVLLVLTDGGNG
jgi:Mn2+/Fe2+ NRAMP family transporter